MTRHRVKVRRTATGCYYAVRVDRSGNEFERGPLVPADKEHEALQHAQNHRRTGAWLKS